MPYLFDEKQCRLISAEDYLRHGRNRGGPLRLKHLGLAFHALADCLYTGAEHQALLPLCAPELRSIFRESCQYLSGERTLAPLVQHCLESGPDVPEIEEAAPFYTPGSSNLWHWMTEGLPKLLALESIGYPGKYIVADSPVVRQSLEMLGVAPERLLPGRGCYRIRNLMLPQRLSGFEMVLHMPLVEFAREKLLAATGRLEGGKRLYIRRIGRRKPLNEEEVLELLREYGFEIMVPEEFSLKEQLYNMTNVECSVMAHGANSTLVLLQKPRSGFVEFFSNRYVSYTNLHAVRLLRLNYRPMVQDMDVSTVPIDSMSLSEFMWSGYEADMEVDAMHLRVALETMLD